MSELPVLLLLLLILAILLRMDLIFYLVYVLTGVYALARWWATKSLTSVRVEHRFTDHIFAGETTRVDVRIENTSWLPVSWLRYDETADVALGAGAITEALSIGPRSKIALSYVLEGRRRGVYKVGPGRLATGDLFGFVEVHGSAPVVEPLVVYPHVIPLAQVELTSRAPYGTIRSRAPIFADPARVVGTRDYQPGDPQRSIDWKSTARMGGLQVKKVEPAVSLTTAIYLDMNRDAYARQLQASASEWAVVVAASLAAHLHRRRQCVGLGSNGADVLEGATCWTIPPRSGQVHLMKLLEWLARVRLAETAALSDWLATATMNLGWGATVIAIAPTGSEEVCAALGRVRRSGLNPVLVAVEPHAQFGRVRERARQLGVLAYQVADTNDLRRWQAGRPGGVVR